MFWGSWLHFDCFVANRQYQYLDELEKKRQLISIGQTISLQSCNSSTGCLWGHVSSLSWLCSYTSRWMVQHLDTCPMTASLSQMLATVGFTHLMSPPVWSRALTHAAVTEPSKSLDPDSGTVCRLHCVSPTRQAASSRNCWSLICLAETAAH